MIPIMRKAVFLIITLFFIWILPLGVFIKPAQEKTACNGQRAICLCSSAPTESGQSDSGAAPQVYKGGTGGEQKEPGGPGGAGHDFLIADVPHQLNAKFSRIYQQQTLLYSFLIPHRIEHVPKA